MDYTELFQLCGFEPVEIDKERPRIDKAFQRFGITDDDVKRAVSRLKKYYNVELKGVRKLLGVWMKELIAIALARDEHRKVVYAEWPGAGNVLLLGAVRSAPDVYLGTPVSHSFTIVLGGIFDKLKSILESGEALGMPPGSAHCGLWQMHVGAIVNGLIPRPDLIVASGWLCDQAAEADQVLAELYGIPVVYLNGCQDWQWDELPELGVRQIKYLSAKMWRVGRKIEEVTGIKINDDVLRAGLKDMSKTYYNFQTLVDLMAKADPQPISQSNLDLIYMTVFTPLKNRDQVVEAVTTLCSEVKQLVDEGKGVVPKGAPRVFLATRPAINPAVWKMVEEIGLATPVCLLDWIPPSTYDKSKYTDRMEALIAGIYRVSPVCSSSANIRYDVSICKNYNVDGAVIMYPFSCRSYAINPLMIKKAIKDQLGIPAIAIEFGGYDTREYPAAMLRTRMEAFAELVMMNKAAKAA